MKAGLQRVLKASLYVAAIIVVPGALIGAPILWWISRHDRRRELVDAH